MAHALSIGVPVCIAVADRSGALLAFARMDGAPQMSATIAQDKAYTVAAFAGLPTHQWYDLIKDDPPVLHGIVKTDRLIVFGGGVPIRSAEGVTIVKQPGPPSATMPSNLPTVVRTHSSLAYCRRRQRWTR